MNTLPFLRTVLFVLVLQPGMPGAAEDYPPVTTARTTLAPVVHEAGITGTVVSPRVSQLSTRVAGWIVGVHVEAGDAVDADAALLSLDPELVRIALAGAEARLAEAEAQLADDRRRLAEAERLKADRTIAQTEVHARRAQVNIAAAVKTRVAADLRRQASLLDRHILKAPYAGTISRRMSNPGEWVEPGTPVLELVATDALRIDFQVPQELYPRVSVGLPIEIRFDALDATPFNGRITGIVPMGDSEVRSFVVLTQLDDPVQSIMPGMSARGTLRLASGREGVVVPRDAVLRHPDGRVTVWTVTRGDGAPVVSEQVIAIGRSFGGAVEVLEGLAPDSEIVVRGNERLAEGQRVSIGAP